MLKVKGNRGNAKDSYDSITYDNIFKSLTGKGLDDITSKQRFLDTLKEKKLTHEHVMLSPYLTFVMKELFGFTDEKLKDLNDPNTNSKLSDFKIYFCDGNIISNDKIEKALYGMDESVDMEHIETLWESLRKSNDSNISMTYKMDRSQLKQIQNDIEELCK